MKNAVGSILSFGGFAALVYTSINYINGIESFDFIFINIDMAAGRGDITPVIISAVVMILGLMIPRFRR